jgi:hypothetical protein
VNVKPMIAGTFALVGLFSLAIGQSKPDFERSTNPERLNSFLTNQHQILLVGSSFPWAGLDKLLADGLRSKTLNLRILTTTEDIPRWRDWVKLGALVRGHPGKASPYSLIVTEGLALVPDPKKADFIVFNDLQTPKVIADRLELAWQYAKPQ